jgi:hypothetical protein
VSKQRPFLFALPAFVLALAVWYGLSAHHAPAGQPPLATMDLAQLKAEFNRGSAQTRVILLLSPT